MQTYCSFEHNLTKTLIAVHMDALILKCIYVLLCLITICVVYQCFGTKCVKTLVPSTQMFEQYSHMQVHWKIELFMRNAITVLKTIFHKS